MTMGKGSDSNGWSRARGLVLTTLVLSGGAFLLKRRTKSTARWDHARIVAEALSGEKFSREQASRDSDYYFNLRMLSCPAAEMVDGSRVLILNKHFGELPFRQLSSYATRDAEEYKCFCDRTKDQRPLPEEVIGNGATYCTSELTVLKSREIHTWDRGYDNDGNQVWGVMGGPYEFKPTSASSFNDMFSPLNFPPQISMEKRIEDSFVVQEYNL